MSVAADLARTLAENPGAVIEDVARAHKVTTHTVIEALPAAMRRFAPGSAFIAAMQDIATWGDVTLIVHTEDGIMEFGGPLPAGAVARGYYNVPGSKGFHGHLRHARCARLAFVERPFMGRPSASILFFNIDGGIVFKVFVGRDENVKHKEDEYVRGDAHTNTAEGFFSIFKRGMTGVYQHCNKRHLRRYLAEFDFRYSNRVKLGVDDIARTERALKGIVGKRLTYRMPHH